MDLHLSFYELRYPPVPNVVHERYESIRNARGDMEPLVSAVARDFSNTLDSERIVATTASRIINESE
ncbi:MAG: hypothetical protein DMG97_22735 [Acidobacteria bacterium]|nr:MAG: hypothetical protein DMG98_09625 [Acidobacteriota bacterium]PYV69142.1 MAG: hypothetical protein DMG97_22735 [Acidobacteriota bacterium]